MINQWVAFGHISATLIVHTFAMVKDRVVCQILLVFSISGVVVVVAGGGVRGVACGAQGGVSRVSRGVKKHVVIRVLFSDVVMGHGERFSRMWSWYLMILGLQKGRSYLRGRALRWSYLRRRRSYAI